MNYLLPGFSKASVLSFSGSERSGKKKRIKEAIPGRKNPITNQSFALRPMLFAKNEVEIGRENKIMIPKKMNPAAPMFLVV
jgi:hypothetical protein